jgi:hypothetical protein
MEINTGDISNMVTASVSVTMGGPQPEPTKLTKVKITYPKDYGKKKFFKDGETRSVSTETAKQFLELGIATIIDETKEPTIQKSKAVKP